MNERWSDRMDYLAGRNGVIEYANSLRILDGSDGDRYFGLRTGTTAQRPAAPNDGYTRLRFNTDTNRFEHWNGSEWEDVGYDTGIVTFENLDANGSVGSGSEQVAQGDHQGLSIIDERT